ELEKVDAPGYNEIQIDTTGTNYHRRVEVFGDSSDSFKEPRAILAGQGKEKHRYLVHFETEQGVVDVRHFTFDFKQFRYLLVRVSADASTGGGVPHIPRVRGRRAVGGPGKYVPRRATLGPRQAVPAEGGPGSAWFIDRGEPVPCERLSFQVAGEPVKRPFRLQ